MDLFCVLQIIGCSMMSEGQEAGDVSLQEHTQSLLHNIRTLDSESLFSDLQIICDDGVVPSYW